MTRLQFLTAMVVLLAGAVLAAAVVLTLAVSDLHQTDAQTHKLAAEAKALGAAIQSQRTETVRSTCLAQNTRHRHTVRALDRILKRAERHSPARRRARIRANRASTVPLIDSLAPYQNCAAVVRRATTTTRRPR